jgi:hypothetical protein
VVDGINYLFIKKNGLYFVVTTKFNVSPSFVLELLDRLAKVFKVRGSATRSILRNDDGLCCPALGFGERGRLRRGARGVAERPAELTWPGGAAEAA